MKSGKMFGIEHKFGKPVSEKPTEIKSSRKKQW